MSVIARYVAHSGAEISDISHYYFEYRLYCFSCLRVFICKKVENT
jgi:hypothetical protein